MLNKKQVTHGTLQRIRQEKNSHDTRRLGSLEVVKMAQEDTGRVKECHGDTSKLSSLNYLCMLTEIIYSAS